MSFIHSSQGQQNDHHYSDLDESQFEVESSFDGDTTEGGLHNDMLKICAESGLGELARDSVFTVIYFTKEYFITQSQPIVSRILSSKWNTVQPQQQGRKSSKTSSAATPNVQNNNNNNNTLDLSLNSSFNGELPLLNSGLNHLFENVAEAVDTKKSTKEDKSKGLRYLSIKVCQKVQSKKNTSYVEVSNELLEEFIQENVKNGANVTDLKTNTMKRRIYDVLNVFQAMNIISKDKQKISWIGLPNALPSSNGPVSLDRQKSEIKSRIRAKKAAYKELLYQEKVYQTLIDRNTKLVENNEMENDRIHLPFIVVNTKNTTVINCEVEGDRSRYFFNFSQPFELHEDNDLVKRLTFIPPPNTKPPHHKKKRKKDEDDDDDES
eukprot:gene10855-12645_t